MKICFNKIEVKGTAYAEIKLSTPQILSKRAKSTYRCHKYVTKLNHKPCCEQFHELTNILHNCAKEIMNNCLSNYIT